MDNSNSPLLDNPQNSDTPHKLETVAVAEPIPMLDLSRQYAPIRDEIIAALTEVVDRQQFILGQPVLAFETAAAEHLEVREAIGCASGTDALWLALAAAGVGPGDAVVTTPFSFFASVSSILRAGATALLSDIDPVTFNLDPNGVEKLLHRKQATPIRAIMPVHLFGQCVDWGAYARLGTEHEVHLIEDAAQAFGARWNGALAGGLGEIAAFSFYPTKNLSAAGDAGMVTTNRAELAERVRMLRQHGMRQRYHHDEVGWNARMDGFQAAVLKINLSYVDQRNALRRRAAERYSELFQNAGLAENGVYPNKGVVLPREVAGAEHIWHQYVVRTPRRDELRAYLASHQIGSEIYYPVPLHRQLALASLGYAEGSFPEAERAAREVLALPIFPELRPDEQERVVATIADFLS